MPQSSILPIIIKPQFGGDAAFVEMVNAARRAGGEVKGALNPAFEEIGRTARQALSKGLSTGGALDIDIPGLQAAAIEAKAYRETIAELARVSEKAALETNDLSQATRDYLSALKAEHIEARKSYMSASDQLRMKSKLQEALRSEAGTVSELTEAYRALALAQNSGKIAEANQDLANRRFENFAGVRTQYNRPSRVGDDGGVQMASTAREAAAAFEAMFAAEDLAAAGAKRLAADIELVRRAIDPTRVAQQQLDVELARADRAFEQGAISANEYGIAVNRAADNFQGAVTGAKQGTSAFGAVTNSVRAQRVAMVQAGQQLQDMAIQFQAGTRSSTILAQQLPQLAFAFSGLGGRVGTVARIMSGPWSLALVAGSALLGGYIDELIRGAEASDKTGSATSRLTDKLDLSKNSYEALKDVVDEYNASQEKSEALTYKAIKAQEELAATTLRLAETRLAALEADDPTRGALNNTDAAAAVAGQEQAIARQRARIEELKQDLRNASVAGSNERVRRQTDQRYAIEVGYDEKLVALEERRKKGLIEQVDYEKQRLSLIRQQTKALEDYDKSQRKSGSSGAGTGARDARVGDMAALIKQLFPSAKITSTTGGKHTKGSDHYSGRAIDFVVPGMMNPAGTAEVERRLEEAGVDIRRNAKGTKQFFGPGRSASKPGDHDDHFHAAWKGTPSPEKAEAAVKAAADQAFRLAEFAADADDRIGRMRQSFQDTPPAIAQMLSGLATLDDLASDIDKKVKDGLDPKVAEALKAKLEELRPVIEDSINQPFRDMVKASEEQRQIDELLIAGKQDEAEVLSRIFTLRKQQGDLTAEQVADIRDLVSAERARSRELEKQNELRQREVDLIESTRDNLRDTMQSLARGGGIGAIGKLFERQFDLMLENTVDNLFEQVFGDFFRDEKDKALGFDKVREASDRQVDSIKTVTSSLDSMATALASATGAIQGKFSDAANDNFDPFAEIVVMGSRKTGDKKGGGPLQSKVPASGGDFTSRTTTLIASLFVKPEDAKKIGDAFSKALRSDGAAYGAMASGLAFGNQGTGGQILSTLGGALGEKVLGPAIGKGLSSIASGLGNLGGPLGGIIGGLAGGLIGSLMTSTPRASATIGGVNGSLGVVSTRGNSAQFRKASEGSAGEAIDTLDRIAEALGATIDASLGSVSIGVRKGNYRVDTSGRGITKTSKGAIDFGEDSAAAIRAATMDLIKDNVLRGLRDSTRRLLQGADDLDKAIKDALDFEGVFTRLKEIKDPLGAAMDALNKEFEGLIRLFQRAGASTEEFAALEELYGLERAKAIKDATESMVGPLKDLIADLETGDNGLSLRARRENALSAFNPLANAIRAGQTVDYNEFTDAARTLLEISRELFGSQDEYFATFNDILNLSKTALAGQENVVSIADGAPSPFISVDTVPVVQAVDAQSQMLLQQLSAANGLSQDILNAILALSNAGGQQANGTYF